jgi:hypothetical protein
MNLLVIAILLLSLSGISIVAGLIFYIFLRKQNAKHFKGSRAFEEPQQ